MKTREQAVAEKGAWDKAELITIQLTLSKDDVSFLQEIVESGEDMGIGICKHIVEQYNAVKAKG
jgi:hypothetical protein